MIKHRLTSFTRHAGIVELRGALAVKQLQRDDDTRHTGQQNTHRSIARTDERIVLADSLQIGCQGVTVIGRIINGTKGRVALRVVMCKGESLRAYPQTETATGMVIVNFCHVF